MEWTEGLVVGKRTWAAGLFTLSIAAPGVRPFEPGQFLQLGFNLPDGHLHRPYSVASPHGDILEFFIVLVETGRLTPHLWALEPGGRLDVSVKAAGSFTLRKCPDAESIWLIATGTGLAPYIAMLRCSEVWQRYRQVVLVHGIRHETDLAYLDEIAGYRAEHPGQFRFVPVVSRQQVPGALHGRITTCVTDGTLEVAAGTSLGTDCCVMMCGNPQMLDEMEQLLGSRGLQRHRTAAPGQIVIERYW